MNSYPLDQRHDMFQSSLHLFPKSILGLPHWSTSTPHSSLCLAKTTASVAPPHTMCIRSIAFYQSISIHPSSFPPTRSDSPSPRRRPNGKLPASPRAPVAKPPQPLSAAMDSSGGFLTPTSAHVLAIFPVESPIHCRRCRPVCCCRCAPRPDRLSTAAHATTSSLLLLPSPTHPLPTSS